VANLEGERLETISPLRTPMNHGIHLAISSDILPIGPNVGWYGAVTRKGRSGRVFGAGERLSMTEALKGCPINGAYLSHEETIKGALERAKLADTIVLMTTPWTWAPRRCCSSKYLKPTSEERSSTHRPQAHSPSIRHEYTGPSTCPFCRK